MPPEALLAYLDTRNDVAGRKVGAVGFCMGGGMALAAAGTYPNRAGASPVAHNPSDYLRPIGFSAAPRPEVMTII